VALSKIQGALLLMVLLFLIFGFRSEPVLSAEVAPVTLKPCPSSPNCVSSLAEDSKHRTDPFLISGTTTETLTLLARAIETIPRATLRQQGGLYLKAEFRTRLGFVDDLEFLVDEDRSLAQVRSASRIGDWDLGLNRKRLRREESGSAESRQEKKLDFIVAVFGLQIFALDRCPH
jgi:uncharacterized protein (DUF1499 family)